MTRSTAPDLQLDHDPRYRGAMATRSAVRSWAQRSWVVPSRERVLDIGLWLLVCAPLVASPFLEQRDLRLVDALAATMALGLILVRRRWPIPVLVVGLSAVVLVTAIVGRPTALIPATVVLLFNVAVRSDRSTSIRAGLAGIAALLCCIAILMSSEFFGPELLAGLAWPALAVAAGDAVRSRREAIEAADERAARAEATREQEARRRVAEERLHIARELHDVVAHRIAVINVQSGVAAHLIHTSPADAENALAIVRSSAGQVLDELAGLLSVLRTHDDPISTDPTPTIEDIPALITSFGDAGLCVDYETSGDSDGPAGDGVGIAVYRTLQEALTNAHKHGRGAAQVRLHQRADAVELVVTNRIAEGRRTSSGFGLIGMRERVHAAGGELTTDLLAEETFVVDATFPRTRLQQAT
jgi:signal transduction histidine kinase